MDWLLVLQDLRIFPICAFCRFTPGLGALGSTGGSSGTNGSNATPSENTSPTAGTTEPGHQQFIQQMLQALAGVNPQVSVLFHSSFVFLNVGNLEISKKKEKGGKKESSSS